MQLEPGTTLGHYEILAPLGAGWARCIERRTPSFPSRGLFPTFLYLPPHAGSHYDQPIPEKRAIATLRAVGRNGDRIRKHPMLRHLDLPPLGADGRGGPLLTKTLLISALSAGGSDDGPQLVARDKLTGEEVAAVDLPAGALGTPMTYMIDGKQYIALTIAGPVPELIALALP